MVLLPGAVTITELMLPEATMGTTTMPTAAPPCGPTVPARPPDVGVARLPGIMGAEALTALEAVPLPGAAVPEVPRDSEAAPLRGAAALEAPQDSEAALLHGGVVPVRTAELTAVQAPGAGDN
jgi:hypothetical protein